MIETLLILVILIALFIKFSRRPKNLPPGPISLPIIGNLSLINHKYPQKYFDRLYEKFGPYYTIQLGWITAIVVNGWQAVNEALLNDDLLGRPDVCLIRDRFDGENYGVLFTEGESWKTQRRFSLHHFRNLGFGRKDHEAIIQEEARELNESIGQKNGQPFEMLGLVSTSNVNITWCLLGGKRFSHSDVEINYLVDNINECMHDIKMFGSIASGIPFLRYIFPESTGYKSIKQGCQGILNFVQKTMTDHSESRDRENPRDFIDIYLEELKKSDLNNSFSEKQLQGICMDILCAGADTSSSVMCFAVLFLCLRQDLQQNIYKEIEDHVGADRLPSMQDKTKLVLAEAVILEVLRMRTPAPTILPHRALKDSTLGGYFVPKHTVIIPNLNSIFMDKEYWGDPEDFRPERFISSDGKLRRDERLIPFGRGKRTCLGETLAKSTTFILLTSLVQKYKFSFDPSLPLPSTEGVPGFTLAAPFFRVIATPRT